MQIDQIHRAEKSSTCKRLAWSTHNMATDQEPITRLLYRFIV